MVRAALSWALPWPQRWGSPRAARPQPAARRQGASSRPATCHLPPAGWGARAGRGRTRGRTCPPTPAARRRLAEGRAGRGGPLAPSPGRASRAARGPAWAAAGAGAAGAAGARTCGSSQPASPRFAPAPAPAPGPAGTSPPPGRRPAPLPPRPGTYPLGHQGPRNDADGMTSGCGLRRDPSPAWGSATV
ncbi:hypothetical protein VULLAG_LOCUS3193 [Vulpes lagopus]